MKVDLIVRDTCRLRPGIQGFPRPCAWSASSAAFSSTAASTISATAAREEYFIGSADCMKRNLESRVEVIAPVEDPALRKELRAVLDCQLAPNDAPGRCGPTAAISAPRTPATASRR